MTPLPPAEAERLALAALSWIAEAPERTGAFLAAAGAGPDALRARAREPEFLGFVLDFVLQEDAQVIEAAAAAGCRPEDLVRARAGLPGGDLPEWT